jgi:hypothetical protein
VCGCVGVWVCGCVGVCVSVCVCGCVWCVVCGVVCVVWRVLCAWCVFGGTQGFHWMQGVGCPGCNGAGGGGACIVMFVWRDGALYVCCQGCVGEVEKQVKACDCW